MRHRPVVELLLALLLSGCQPLPVQAPFTPGEFQRQRAQAEGKFLTGDFGEAEALYHDAVERAPSPTDEARAKYWRGVCRLKLGRTNEARGDFQSYLNAHAGSALEFEATEGLADCAREQERFDEAAKVYEALAARTPASSRRASLLRRLAECRSKAGDSAEAWQARRMAAKLEQSREIPGSKQPVAADQELTVQVGAFSKRRSADALVRRLRAQGLPAEVHSRQVGGHLLYCVRSGQFSDKAEAERHAQRLKRIGLEAIVAP